MKFSGVTILQGVEFSIFPIDFEWALQQCSATALPVIGICRICRCTSTAADVYSRSVAALTIYCIKNISTSLPTYSQLFLVHISFYILNFTKINSTFSSYSANKRANYKHGSQNISFANLWQDLICNVVVKTHVPVGGTLWCDDSPASGAVSHCTENMPSVVRQATARKNIARSC